MNRQEFLYDLKRTIKREGFISIIIHSNLWLAYLLSGSAPLIHRRGTLLLCYRSNNGNKWFGLHIKFKNKNKLRKSWDIYMEKISMGMMRFIFGKRI